MPYFTEDFAEAAASRNVSDPDPVPSTTPAATTVAHDCHTDADCPENCFCVYRAQRGRKVCRSLQGKAFKGMCNVWWTYLIAQCVDLLLLPPKHTLDPWPPTGLFMLLPPKKTEIKTSKHWKLRFTIIFVHGLCLQRKNETDTCYYLEFCSLHLRTTSSHKHSWWMTNYNETAN